MMQLEKTRIRIRCELGACRAVGEYSIRFARVGIRSRLHICGACLKELAELAKVEFASVDEVKEKEEVRVVEAEPITEPIASAPKSIETLKPKKSKR